MATILSIETSTNVCSVAVAEDNHVIFRKEDYEGPSHAVQCGLFVQEALSFAESHAIPLDAVAVRVKESNTLLHSGWWGMMISVL